MNKQELLQNHLTQTIHDVIEDHPGPTTEQLAADIAATLIKALGLRASGVFIDDNDPEAPVKRFRAIEGTWKEVAYV